jgi:hypothetical protein
MKSKFNSRAERAAAFIIWLDEEAMPFMQGELYPSDVDGLEFDSIPINRWADMDEDEGGTFGISAEEACAALRISAKNERAAIADASRHGVAKKIVLTTLYSSWIDPIKNEWVHTEGGESTEFLALNLAAARALAVFSARQDVAKASRKQKTAKQEVAHHG